MSNVINRHKARWCECGDGNGLSEAIENFNELVDEKLAPSVHTVKYTKPFEYDINNRFETNILVSDISRQEQIKDQKLLHVKLDSELGAGSYIWWNNFPWLVLNEENNSVQSHKTYTMMKCGITINIQYDGNYYQYPVTISNLTLYSDGEKELLNLTLSSAKYSIQISENEITNTIDVDTRFIIRGRAFETSLIDDFTVLNVRTLTVCETVVNSLDDLNFDMAYNKNSEIEDIVNPNLVIMGNDVILIGDTTEYTLPKAISWELEENEALSIVLNEEGKCKIKCKSNSFFIGEQVKLKALDANGRILDEKNITIRGLF